MNPPKTEITEAVLFMPFTWGRKCFSLLLIRFLSLFVAKGCWFLSRLLSAFVFWFRSHQTTATISRKFFSDDGVNRLFCFLSGFSEKMVTYFCVNIRHRLFMENIFFLYKIYHGNSPVVETDFKTHTLRMWTTSVTTSDVAGWLQIDGCTVRELETASYLRTKGCFKDFAPTSFLSVLWLIDDYKIGPSNFFNLYRLSSLRRRPLEETAYFFCRCWKYTASKQKHNEGIMAQFQLFEFSRDTEWLMAVFNWSVIGFVPQTLPISNLSSWRFSVDQLISDKWKRLKR